MAVAVNYNTLFQLKHMWKSLVKETCF